jgi:hypothetical protein
MAKDAELDRLKAAQDRAFQRKQAAYQAQQRAWEKLSSARDAMNRAHEAKQCAYADQDQAWQRYQSVRNANGPRIDSLNSQQEQAFQSMKSAFESASSAHDRRDGASAASYAADGHRYKADAQGYVTERRRLVEEIRSARATHDASKPAFQRAKDDFSTCKRSFESARAEHERRRAEFKQAKADFDSCAQAFKSRLDTVRSAASKRREDKSAVAAKAGVPYQYRDNLWVSTDSNGNTNIYFGGAGEPNGPGHGHYVMDRNGNVTYKRDPFDPHGAQNFEGPGRDGHRGGFGKSQHGWIGDSPVTFALGWGTREGHTMIADGHLDDAQFRGHGYHDHYGPGDGPNSNGTLRRRYTGPGA